MPAPVPHHLRGRLAASGRLPKHDPHNQAVRDLVRQRARDSCEYCLMPTTSKFEIEHIVPRARWADYQANAYAALRRRSRLNLATPNHIANYAWACVFCNGAKGGRRRPLGSVRLFDPRYDNWPDHFEFLSSASYAAILGLTAIGVATVVALKFNRGGPEGPLVARHVAIMQGIYPPHWARAAYRL